MALYNADPISSSPAVVDGILYAGYVGGFCALNASNGGFLWNFATPYMRTYSSPVVFNGVVFTRAGIQTFTHLTPQLALKSGASPLIVRLYSLQPLTTTLLIVSS